MLGAETLICKSAPRPGAGSVIGAMDNTRGGAASGERRASEDWTSGRVSFKLSGSMFRYVDIRIIVPFIKGEFLGGLR